MTFNTYDEKDPCMNEYYEKEQNFEIRYNDVNNNCCYIYFSSNGLYKRNDIESFRHMIDYKRFEWKHLSAKCKPRKEIFVRDIWLSWYVKGINSRINSIDAIITWLRLETKGYQIVTVGNSSGGYMATIAAIKLKALLCYNISGQFSLENHNNHVNVNPLLKKYHKLNQGQYYECYKMLKESNIPIVYCYPKKVDHDLVQSTFVKNFATVYSFSFDSSIHGRTVNSFVLPEFISCSLSDIEKMYIKFENETIRPIEFSFYLCGIIKTLRNMFSYYTYKVIGMLKRTI